MPGDSTSQQAARHDLVHYYDAGYEENRLETGPGKLERERSRELLSRFLPPPPAVILDVGGGAGPHALWLARRGYEVHLIDIVPLHIEQALQASSAQPETPLASAAVEDARHLSRESQSVDGVVLFGPMYHLTERADRLGALQEAHRVLKSGGVLLAAGISRFASALDGLRSGFLKDPAFAAIVEQDLRNGHHRNPTDRPEYFMDAFFHHPDELREEVAEAGFVVNGVYGVEGPPWLLSDFDEWWKDDELRERLLRVTRTVEQEPSLLGASAHLIVVARKPSKGAEEPRNPPLLLRPSAPPPST